MKNAVLFGWKRAINAPNADRNFSNAPIWNWNDSKLKFNWNWVSNANENYGSASAVLPVCLPYERAPTSIGAFSLRWIVSIRQAFGQFLVDVLGSQYSVVRLYSVSLMRDG